MSCLIHGMVNRPANRVITALDDIELQTAHKDVYKEALYFSSLRSDKRIGFTVANILPFSKTFLTLVSNLIFNIKIMKSFESSKGCHRYRVLYSANYSFGSKRISL